MPMRNHNKKTSDNGLADLGVLYDGAEDDTPTPLDGASVSALRSEDLTPTQGGSLPFKPAADNTAVPQAQES